MKGERLSGLELEDVVEESLASEGGAEGHQVVREGVVIGPGGDLGVSEDGFESAGDDQLAAVLRVEERLDAEAIPGGEEGSFVEVVNREREHAAESREAVGAVGLEGLHEEFGVAGRFLLEALSVEPGLEGGGVVEFAVVDEGESFVVGYPGLRGRGEVADGETSMGEGDFAVEEKTGIVGAAVGHGVSHGAQCRLVETRGAARGDDADEAAHGGWSLGFGNWELAGSERDTRVYRGNGGWGQEEMGAGGEGLGAGKNGEMEGNERMGCDVPGEYYLLRGKSVSIVGLL